MILLPTKMLTNRANLFVLGAQRSGTTSLHHYLSHVHNIFMCHAKETFFFTQKNWRDYDNYHRHFEIAGDVKFIGESSTAYTMQPAFPSVASRIFEYNPRAKLIYIVRDPIERAISNYWWNVQLCQETRSPLQAIKSEPQYSKTSDYAYQIRPYIELFQPQQLKFVLYEDIKHSPQDVIKQICDWLDIEYKIDNEDIYSTIKKQSKQTINRIDTQKWLGKFRASKLWRGFLRKFVPEGIRQIAKPMSSHTINKESSEVLDEIRQVNIYLRPLLKKRTEEFKQMARLDYSRWHTLYPE